MSDDLIALLQKVVASAEAECWRLYESNKSSTSAAEEQHIIGAIQGIGTVLQFIDDELSIMEMEKSL